MGGKRNVNQQFIKQVVNGFGCTDHMTGDASKLSDVYSGDLGEISVASGQKLKITGTGSFTFKHGNNETIIKDVLIVPGLKANLVSISKLAKKGAKTEFHGEDAKVMMGDHVLLSAKQNNEGLFIISSKPMPAAHIAVSMTELHRRMGHLNKEALL